MDVHDPRPPEGSGLIVRDLAVSYGPVAALRGVSLEVPRGSIVTVLGGNGAGKSTLLRAVSGTLGFHRGGVTAGEVRFDGARLSGTAASSVVAAGVVQVPEGRRVFARMTVEENLRAGALGARDRRAAAESRDRVLTLFPVLAERARQRAGLLSGGEQQMLAIGRALMARPRMLLLDEPTLGLAPMMAARIAETVREINGQGTTVLLVEQNAAMALSLASHAYVLEVGEVVLSGPAGELAASDEVRRRYLGVEDDGDDGNGGGGDGGPAARTSGGARRDLSASPRPVLARWSA
ncbi:branched-chain amino acid transport system ATP-binding protein [Streptosporangium becharense]|uniref:Branched-chain amino acid transport system ATP-binding protein n=1 Tax=Streptosporangium becharense TaxID=1816182 RepID=A0A7W9ICI9_9ACTN|nr:ABC transporter ATP-binding protein [Streptosporangium becharense]MBB2912978.1 branched-chain amino acid transport system ATP-binding protein [Streptosporangium becharense]MBB5818197.1 branched-chain amino acid transport system ATP-binding protein [Streptosporangium becharense]